MHDSGAFDYQLLQIFISYWRSRMFGAYLSLFLSFHVVHSLFLKLIEEIGEQPGKILKKKLIGISEHVAEITADLSLSNLKLKFLTCFGST